MKEKKAPDLGQKSGKWSQPFPNRDVSLHSFRPLVRKYATVTAVLKLVIFCTLYDIVEPWEYRELARYLPVGDDNIPKFSPPDAIRDGWRLITAIRK